MRLPARPPPPTTTRCGACYVLAQCGAPLRSVSTNVLPRAVPHAISFDELSLTQPSCKFAMRTPLFWLAVFASVLQPLARLFAAAVSRASRSSGNEVSQRPVQQLSGCQPIDRASVLPKNASLKAHKKMSATTVALDVACGGVSTAVVSAILNPTDVIKTRRQIVGFSGASPLDMARAVARADGLRGLWLPGLQATVLRELLYSGCTKGLYPYARDAVAGEEDASLAQRALAAALTGFGGSLCANAVDVVKVKQFDSGSNRSVVAAMRDVASTRAARGAVARGRRPLHHRRVACAQVSASAPRGAAIAIGEVTTYDYAKSRLARHPAFARDAKGCRAVRAAHRDLGDHGRRGDDGRGPLRYDQVAGHGARRQRVDGAAVARRARGPRAPRGSWRRGIARSSRRAVDTGQVADRGARPTGAAAWPRPARR